HGAAARRGRTGRARRLLVASLRWQRLGQDHGLAGRLLRERGRPILPADERRGERAEAKRSRDEAGGDRPGETEVAEGRGPGRARVHGVSAVRVRHVWHPLPWGGVGKLYAVL